MATWVFGYGSLIWKPGFSYEPTEEERFVGCIKGYRRVFYQKSPEHRGTPERPGRAVTLEPKEGEVCWGVAYKICEEYREQTLAKLDEREKGYGQPRRVDFFTDANASTPFAANVLVYIGISDTTINRNYWGPAPLEVMAKHIALAVGKSGRNIDYIWDLKRQLDKIGHPDKHVDELLEATNYVRDYEG